MSVYILDLTFEHYRRALGISEHSPRLSWRFGGTGKDWKQTGYQIELTRGTSDIHVSQVSSDESVLVPWTGKPLTERESASVRVRAQGTSGEWTAWSAPAVVETAFLEPTRALSTLIEPSLAQNPAETKRPILFRRQFTTPPASNFRARLYITAHGIYEASVNGQLVGSDVFAPGWTNYKSILNYQTYDITSLVRPGENSVGCQVAEGWYSGRLGFGKGNRNVWGESLGLAAKIILTYSTGEEITIETDEFWSCAHGPIISSELYDGELYDARLEQPLWWNADGSQIGWKPVHTSSFPRPERLRSVNSPPVRRIEEIDAIAHFKSPSGKLIVDFGQNLVGWIRIEVPPPYQEGHKVKFVYAEVLEHNECATRPLRTAKATDTLILSASTSESFRWEPNFTFHGFRYVEITDWPGADFQLSNVTAVVIHSDMRRLGTFNCSDDLLNKLHQNIVWSMRGNFLSIPTDCPQRDERLGWTGDIAVFAPTANFLYDTTDLLNAWLQGLTSDQLRGGREDPTYGIPPLISPNPIARMPNFPQAIWGDSVIAIPWALFQSTGDLEILRSQWESMIAWIDFGVKRGPDGLLWDESLHQLADWLDPMAPPSEPGNGRTDPVLVSNAWLIHSTDLMVEISSLLSETSYVDKYRMQAAQLRKEFADFYVTGRGRLSSDSQTAYALALQFHLLPSTAQIQGAIDRLCQLIKDVSRFKIATGFAGTPILGHALTSQSQSQIFYRMLHHKRNPSWLYTVTMGATTVWERWDSMLEDGSINPGEMTSFNHYALGSVASWMHEVIGGLRQKSSSPGWKNVLIKPEPGGLVTGAKVEYLSPYGLITVDWVIKDENDGLKVFVIECCIPPNASAHIVLPGMKDESEAIKVGSGTFNYQVSYDPPPWPPIPKYPPFAPHDDDEP